MNMTEIPEGLEYWTADEIAECLPMIGTGDLYRKLWGFVVDAGEAGTAKPLGGDGSNGTTEIPIVSDSYEAQPKAFWAKLTEAEQATVIEAWALHREGG